MTQTQILNGIKLFEIHSRMENFWPFLRNDILRKHGIIPEKPPSPTAMIEESLIEARRLAHENRLEGKDLDELAELEDEEDEDFLNQYRSVIHNKDSM
jgi:hypothetical protein